MYTWLCQIGKNAWLKEEKRKKRFSPEPLEDLTIPDREPPPEDRLIEKEEVQRVRAAVLRLAEPYRDVFILHTYGGVKLKDIALSLGKSESWARVTYYRAKQQIIEEVTK